MVTAIVKTAGTAEVNGSSSVILERGESLGAARQRSMATIRSAQLSVEIKSYLGSLLPNGNEPLYTLVDAFSRDSQALKTRGSMQGVLKVTLTYCIYSIPKVSCKYSVFFKRICSS